MADHTVNTGEALVVERTARGPVAAAALERHALLDHVDDIDSGDNLVDELFWYSQGDEVYEEYVAVRGDAFEREDRPADTLVSAAVRHVERYLDSPFTNGYRSEILPQLPYWMPAVIGTLERGVALFVDYGYPRSEFYLPERSDGTLVCHYRHRAHSDPLYRPGLQDITAFVDFTAVAEAGTGTGFELVGYAPQGQFLLASGLPALIEEAAAMGELERMRIVAEAKRPGRCRARWASVSVRSRSRAASVRIPASLRAIWIFLRRL